MHRPGEALNPHDPPAGSNLAQAALPRPWSSA